MIKKRVPELALVLLCLVASGVVLGKGISTATEDNGGSIQAAAGTPGPTPAEQTLRSELQVVREYDQRLLSTVYWSLSGVFLLVILVGGINWFTNYRLYERERESLREAAKLATTEEAVKLRRLFDDLRLESASASRETQRDLDAFKRGVREIAEAGYERANAKAAEAIKTTKTEVMRALAQAEHENTQLRAEYRLKNNPYQALLAWRDHLQWLRVIGWDNDGHFIGRALDGIETCLKESKTVTYGLEHEIVKLLENAPEMLRARIAAIRRTMQEADHIN